MADLVEPGGVVVARREAGEWEQFASAFSRVADNVRQVIEGKEQQARLALVCLVAEGHLLIEDVPGVGKTMLAKSIARSIDCSFRRIQFTPDLLPTDVTGVNVYNQERGDFEFKPRALFANLDDLESVTDAPGVSDMVLMARDGHVAQALQRYIVSLAEHTRSHPDVYLGASPRASIVLLRASRALAAAEGRDYVIPDDVKALVVPALSHRILIAADAAMGGRTSHAILSELVHEVPVPIRDRT